MLQYINYESSVYHHNYVETALPWWAPFPALSGTSHSQCWTAVNSHAPETPKLIFPMRYTGTGNSTYSTCQCRETLTLGNKNPVENKSQKRIKMKTKNINQVYFPFYSCLFSTGINFWWWCIDWSSHIQWSNPSKFFVRNVIIRAKSTGVETTQLVRSRLRDLVLSERCGALKKMESPQHSYPVNPSKL